MCLALTVSLCACSDEDSEGGFRDHGGLSDAGEDEEGRQERAEALGGEHRLGQRGLRLYSSGRGAVRHVPGAEQDSERRPR